MWRLPVFTIFASVLITAAACRRPEPASPAQVRPPAPPETAQPEETPPQLPPDSKLVTALWHTPLGRDFFSFLLGPMAAHDVPLKSRQLTDRAFSDRRLLTARITALQMMAEDLYAQGRLEGDALARLVLLEGEFSKRRLNINQSLNTNVIYHAAVFLIASIPYGSPAVREEARRGFHALAEKLRNSAGLPVTLGHESGPAPRRLLSPSIVFKGYQPYKALSFFFNTYGPYSVAYFFVFEWIQASGLGAKDEVLLLGLDELLRPSEL